LTCFTIFDVFYPCLQYNTPIINCNTSADIIGCGEEKLAIETGWHCYNCKRVSAEVFSGHLHLLWKQISCCRLLCKLGALYNREFSRLAMDRLLLRAYEKYMVTPSNLQYVAISHFIGHATD